jgi:hypothetical protein
MIDIFHIQLLLMQTMDLLDAYVYMYVCMYVCMYSWE